MPIKWSVATDDVLDTADLLIEKYHPHLLDAGIGFIFRDKAVMSGGRRVLGEASLISAKMQTQIDLDFLIWIAKDAWDESTEEFRIALIDHELCHCVVNDRGGFTTCPHDVQEFEAIIERHGIYNSSLESFASHLK